ncbi:hypothetical protein BN14_04575 [Rhizoctonia solani AG-1 IB]|uniref:Uncharacterized protein n=1 Tax=Thanatephorus cucumeris (strain AG1-IB / isolate 7/3/14) TaxID=1108050 RepID=M5BTJ7_THACB|nr:hypothetical protein BN14_04575 [Rhizoctonia solani AG-1 IB]
MQPNSRFILAISRLLDPITPLCNAYFGVKIPVLTDAEGTPVLRLDLIDSKTNVTTNQRRSELEVEVKLDERSEVPTGPYSTLSKRSIWDWLFPNKGHTSGGTFAAVKTIGVLYQEDYLPRNSAAATADANGYSGFQVTAFANGTAIPDGSYKILVRALKITGNPTKEEDYEVWTSPTILVKRN